MSYEVESVLTDLESSISLMSPPIPETARLRASQLVMAIEALMQGIHAGSVEATPDQFGRLVACQAAMRIAMDIEELSDG